MGLHSWVVAAPSQKAALAAWDTHVNLFATGDASVTTDPDAIDAAMQSPGDPVALDLDGATEKGLRSLDKPAPARPKATPRKRAEAPHKKPDRSKLDAAEKEAADFKTKSERLRKELESKRAKVLEEIDAEERRLDDEARKVRSKLAKARADYDAQ